MTELKKISIEPLARVEGHGGITVEIKLVVFDDYVLPNTALNNGNIDANIFQHIPWQYLNLYHRPCRVNPAH